MIKLIIENNEIEITDEIQVAITKQFEELSNPTTIINDWSKTVAIPFTVKNNQIFGNIYRIDRLISYQSNQPIVGVNFNPLKKLDFRIEWGSNVIMTGYAKMNDITQTKGNGSYNITLFGQLGKIFQEMKKVTFDNSTEDTDYLIDGSKYVDEVINKELLYNTWTADGQTTDILAEKGDTNYNVADIIGFAPNNAFSEGFDYKVYQDSEISSTSFTETLGDEFYEETGVDADTVIPNGLLPREIGEYRSYLQLPFIYFNKLFQIFQAKSEEITGYKFDLDEDWFSPLNPYWNNLVYMLKPLNPKLGDEGVAVYDTDMVVSGTTDVPASYVWWNWDGHCLLDLYNVDRTSGSINPYISSNNTFSVEGDGDNVAKLYFKPSFRVKYSNAGAAASENSKLRIKMPLVFDFVVTGENNHSERKRVVVKSDYTPSTYDTFIETADVVIEENSYPSISVPSDTLSYEYKWNVFFPDIVINKETFGNTYTIRVDNYFYRDGSAEYPLMFTDSYTYPEGVSHCTTNVQAGETTVNINALNKQFHSGDNFTLNDLWNNDYNLFSEILKYCKMYRIMISIDELNKTIKFQEHTKYFRGYTVTDISNKVDKSKDFTITPITFENKYVMFNYRDFAGKLAKEYKEKYGVNYGEYRLITDYNFNSESKDLFNGIAQSVTNTDYVLSWKNIKDGHRIIYSFPQEVYVYNKDKDKKQVDNFGAYFFHNGSASFSTNPELNMMDVYLSDDTPFQQIYNTYFYNMGNESVQVTTYPKLDIVYDDKMCVFNTPKENYTYINNYADKNTIYTNFWEDYIDERYNIQNKKITCYINIKPNEFNQFQWNKFVTLENQLCFVNKIYDYDANANAPTKVDLITIQNIKGYSENNYDYDDEVVTGSVRFTSLTDGSTVGLAYKSSNQTLEYSMDGSTNWTNLTTADTITIDKGESVYVRGKLTSGTGSRFSVTGAVSIKGKAENLWNYENLNQSLYAACGKGMFRNCTGVVDASKFVINKADSQECFQGAFSGCTNLILPPQLLATAVGNSGYEAMFQNCTNLRTAPKLPATTLDYDSYGYMFDGCTNLAKTSALPALTVPSAAYQYMFKNCSSLKEMPEIKCTTVGSSAFSYMFFKCTNLKKIRPLPATTLRQSCYEYMFRDCTSLTEVPENFLPATTLAAYCYQSMFHGCSSLRIVPINLLPVTTLTDSCYSSMFRECTSLIIPPTLPATTIAPNCYNHMFYYCTSLTSTPTLPARTLKIYCYNGMFNHCTGLTTAPDLLATTLVEGCYNYMFGDCTNLNYIKCLATTISTTQRVTREWVKNVPATGTFVKASTSNIWDTGINGIPSGWTVETE